MKIPWKSSKILRESCDFLWKSYAKSYESYKSPMEVIWKSHVCLNEIPLDILKNTVEILCKSYENSNGNHMKIPLTINEIPLEVL